MSDLGTRIRRLRRDVGLDENQCADLIGVSVETFAAFESGRQKPDLAEVAALARAFGCFVSTILDRSETLNRLEVATRLDDSKETHNAIEVAERLGFFLELDEKLTRADIKAA